MEKENPHTVFIGASKIQKYLLKLIPCRKSNWSHEGSNPPFWTYNKVASANKLSGQNF